MSRAEDIHTSPAPSEPNKKKRNVDQAELEIDVDAPEPPSKKALRKAKKTKDVPIVPGKYVAETNSASSSRPAQDVVDGVNNSGKRSDYGIWIGNLAFATTRADLFDFMSGDADNLIAKEKVTRINLPSNSRNGRFQNKGFAYVDLSDEESLKKALDMSEKLLGGRRVLIKDSKSFEGRPQEGSKATSTRPPNKRIFVGNLSFETTVEDLEAHFGVCGAIHHTQMATFEDSGKCKGYAWIDFEQLSSAQAAIRGWVEQGGQQDGDQKTAKRSKQIKRLEQMYGRKIKMEFAEDKATRYQKRYGKGALKDGQNDNAVLEPPQTTPAIAEEAQKPSDQRKKRAKLRENGYAAETVQRITGAIVEGKGSKMRFD